MPKVSVIIPVYNVEKYLRECLDSVVNQTLKDIEIICVNDGSTDSSLKILEEYASQDNRIKIINQENQGTGAARNNGIDNAYGDYLYFLDSDDFIKPETLEKLYSKITETNSDICFCKNNIFDENTQSFQNITWSTKEDLIPQTQTFSSDDIPETILQICVPNLFLKLYKKEFINTNDIKFQELKTCNDVFFNNSSLIMAKRICYVNEVLVSYRMNHSDCLSANRGRSVLCLAEAYKKLKKYLKNKGAFKKVKNSIYKKVLNNLQYEIRCCTFKEQQFLKKEIKKFLPREYFNSFEYGIRYKTPIEKIFSIKNSIDKKHKIITVLCTVIKIQKKNFLENIISVKNTDIYKQITLFGRQYKFISKKLINKVTEYKINDLRAEINKLKESQNELNELIKAVNYATKPDSILLVEPNDCHGEVIPGYAKYVKDLGFNVDIVITPQQNEKRSLFMFEDTDTNIFILNRKSIKEFLSSKKIEQYKYIVFTSHIMYESINYIIFPTIFQHFPVLGNYRDKLFVVEHHFESVDKQLLENKHIIMLTKLPSQNGNVICANPHYFGDITITSKNPVITEFIMVGAIEAKRRNCNILIDAVNKLVESGFDNFRITVIGRSSMDAIPEKLRKYFNILGYVPYDVMYKEMEKADFFLPLIDPDNPEHDRYITVGTSGSFQLIYGFQKPCLIAEKFAATHYFNNENSIIYKTNSDLADSMQKAILMPQQDYLKKQDALKSLAEDLYKKSLDNLEKIFNGANDERNS